MHIPAALFAALAGTAAALPAAPISSSGSVTSSAARSVITITSATTTGSGCPKGTVSTTFSVDRSVLTFGFDAFAAHVGPGAGPEDRTKSCLMTLNLKYPQGYRFGVAQSTTHTFADAGKGLKATLDTRLWFQGSRAPAAGPKELRGSETVVKSVCGAGAVLMANSTLSLTATGAGAVGSVTADDATFGMTLKMRWESC